uniref:Uncharacterized protein n=1 Tax=Arundo donax TaxID=35708 RepID=A0A0A8Y8R2_ARUDO
MMYAFGSLLDSFTRTTFSSCLLRFSKQPWRLTQSLIFIALRICSTVDHITSLSLTFNGRTTR